MDREKSKNHKGIAFWTASFQDGCTCLDWNSFVSCYQCCGLLWQSSNLLRRVQKPETSYTSQHVCDSSWRKRYLMSIFCMPFSVATLFRDRWMFGESFCRFVCFAAIDICTGFSSDYGINCSELILLHCQKGMRCCSKHKELFYTLLLFGA